MKKTLFLLLACSIIASCLKAQPQNLSSTDIKTSPKVMEDFMFKRFGMFIHWGPVTLRGTEIGWSRGHQVPVEEYDQLYKEFNPVLFDANQWVKAAKDAGMKYLTITSKHHDGFCLWPTQFSDYNISNTPFKRDIVGELSRACKKQGIAFCIYFSVLDWHDKNYPLHHLGDSIPDPTADMNVFVQTMKNELTELITNYHPYMLWFDGNWEKPWTKEYAKEIYALIKKLDPKLIVNNRLGKSHEKVMGTETVGDYATPEQVIGEINMKDPWESCITICNQWAWKPNDKMKTLKESIQTLALTSGGNGNLLYNVGPMPDGRMEKRQVVLLSKMGDWLLKNGASVYGTKGGPYKPNKEYASTRKGNKIFIHVFKQNGKELKLPALPNTIISKVYLLNGSAVLYSKATDGLILHLPDELPDENDAVIVFEIDKDSETLPLIEN